MPRQTLIDEGPTDSEFSLKVGQSIARVLHLGDWLAEGLALARVIAGDIEGLLRRPHRSDRDGEAFLRKFTHECRHGATFGSKQIRSRHPYLIEEHFRSVGGELPQLF